MHKNLLKTLIGVGILVIHLPAESQTQVTPVAPASASITTGIPTYFQFDRTLIIPGQFAFIALPFEKQEKGGICVAASTYNVLKYQDAAFPLNQRELFRVFNNESSGSNKTEMTIGLRNIGWEVTHIEPCR